MASIDSRLKRLEQRPVNQPAPELTLVLSATPESMEEVTAYVESMADGPFKYEIKEVPSHGTD